MSIFDSGLAGAAWPALDRRFLQTGRRTAPPTFPLEVLAEPWRPWIERQAQAATCVDYAAQALLAAVSAVCGSRFVVDVTPYWREPLVLWQALVGGPSAGKTPALVAGRRLLAGVAAPPDEAIPEDEQPPGDEPVLTPWLVNRGMSSWSDDLEEALPVVSSDRKGRRDLIGNWTGEPSDTGEEFLDVGQRGVRFAGSVFGTLQADRLAEALAGIDGAILSRFLYGWPVPRLEARLKGWGCEDDGAAALLQRLVDLPGRTDEPTALTLDEAATDRLEALLPPLRAFGRDTDGLEAAWIGKAAGNIVRLAGLLCLMDGAARGAPAAGTAIDEAQLDRAHALWCDYYWPHAQAVFGEGPVTTVERRVRRAGRWLCRTRPGTVSREQMRREALGQSVNADGADAVIERLEQYGALRMQPVDKEERRGPRKLRWQVNPELWAN
jgi:hypothetical protein